MLTLVHMGIFRGALLLENVDINKFCPTAMKEFSEESQTVSPFRASVT